MTNFNSLLAGRGSRKTIVQLSRLNVSDEPKIFLFDCHQDRENDGLAAELERAHVSLQTILLPAAESSHSDSNRIWLDRFVGDLLTGKIDAVVMMTSQGAHDLVAAATAIAESTRFLGAIQDCQLVSGSIATTAALRKYGLVPSDLADRLTSWRDTLKFLERQIELSQKRIAIESTLQDHGLLSGLEARGTRPQRLLSSRNSAGEVSCQDSETQTRLIELCHGDASVLLVPSPSIASRLCRVLSKIGQAPLTKLASGHHIIVGCGEETSDCLAQNSIEVDLTIQAADCKLAATELISKIQTLTAKKQAILMNMSGPTAPANDTNAPWYNSPFMKACRREPTDMTPVWMMRQAGRYMSEYREVRANVSFLDLCANPQLCSEVMCTAVERLGVDVAIIFSDLLPILVPMGLELEFVKGDGPVIHNPVRSAADIDRIKPLENNDELQFVMDTVTQTRADLPADMPLIGFSGAPFTLASYMIEGGGSRNYAHAKSLMFGDAGAWNELMQRLTDSIVIYLQGQIDAGAQCVQLFDSWAGCLNVQHYRDYVLPYVQQIIERLPEEVPVINFGTGNPALLPLYAETKASVIGIDWRVRLDEAWETVGHDRAVQGNLDPTILLTDPATIRKHVKEVLDQAAGRPGHIFNLGHGILPMTPVDNAIALVDSVHELSQR